jgi:oligopeptide transport system permease protein
MNDDRFKLLTAEEKKTEAIVRPSVTYLEDAWRRLKANKTSFVSLITIIVIILSAIFVPVLSRYTYEAQVLRDKNLGVSAAHWFGTDHLGRDVFVRVFYGARYSLTIAFVAAFINLIIGVVYGSISGFAGGKIDGAMMRFVDVLYSIPLTIYVIILMVLLNKPGSGGSEISTIVLALCISYWIGMARIVRGKVLQLKQQEFVLAAKALGASNMRIIVKHLIPNSFGAIIVTLTLLIPSAVFTEAFLSYIGLGISAPRASLGTLANEALKTLSKNPSQMFFPAAMICLIILTFNLFGDGLKDALDPKMKN